MRCPKVWGLLDERNVGQAPADIPLIGVKCSCILLNTLAEVTITQRYRNTSSNPIQAVYVFPVDDEAAVNGFTANLGERTVRGVIRGKEEARRTYEDALHQGHGAALLETAGGGALSLRVGNLSPGCEAEICIVYSTLCAVEGSAVVLKVPTTIKERYMPAAQLQPSDKTAQPTYKGDVGYGLSLDADVFMSSNITSVSSSTHPLSVRNDPDDRRHCTAKLGVEKVAMDGDVIIRVEHADIHKPALVLCSQPNVDHGTGGIMLSFVPELFDEDPSGSGASSDEVHEFVFLVDRSGSMGYGGHGDSRPIDQCRDALQLFLRSLPEGCLFNIVGFGSQHQKLFSESRVYDPSSLEEATRHVSQLNSDMGGTEILRPLKDVLSGASASQGLFSRLKGSSGGKKSKRNVFLLTDGAVGNTQEVIRTVKEHSGTTRVFTFGVGDGAASDLIKGVARAGRGESCFIRHGEPIDEKVITQLGKAMEPVLEDVSIDWGILSVEKQSPLVNDLGPVFNNVPYTVFALLTKDSQHQGQVVLSGSLNGTAQRFAVDVTPWTTTRTDCHILHSLAAKRMIRDVEEASARPAGFEKQVADLSLRFEVASSQASFVAVEEREVPEDGMMKTVQVPLNPVSAALDNSIGYRRGVSRGGGRGLGKDGNRASFSFSPRSACPAPRAPPKKGVRAPRMAAAPPPQKFRPSHTEGFELCPAAAAPPSYGEPPPCAAPPPCGADEFSTITSGLQDDFSLPAAPATRLASQPPPPPPQKMSSSPRSAQQAVPTASSLSPSSADSLQSLAALQATNGSWQLEEHLAAAVKLSKESITGSMPADLRGHDTASSIWATAIAIAFLLEKCSEKQVAFSLMEKKARKWLAKQNGWSAEMARQLITSARNLFQ